MEENEIIQLIRKLQANPLLYFENCLKIQNFGTGELIPFKLNEVQQIMHSMMQRQLAEHNHVRMIVLKARRLAYPHMYRGGTSDMPQ